MSRVMRRFDVWGQELMCFMMTTLRTGVYDVALMLFMCCSRNLEPTLLLLGVNSVGCNTREI